MVRKIRVFIFDDEPSLLKLYTTMLEMRGGYEIHTFSDPSCCPVYSKPECDCPMEESCCDIIITDMRMPNVDGLQFIENQKKKGCKVKHIILVSAYNFPEIRDKIKELGCEFLRKPFMFEELFEWLDKCDREILGS